MGRKNKKRKNTKKTIIPKKKTLKKKKNSRQSKTKKVAKKGRKSLKPTFDKGVRKSARKPLIGFHCQYVDLCMIERMSESGCNSGRKFVIKAPKGTRRQFLMLDGSKVIAFLEKGKKITDCGGNLTDVTTKVTCKSIPGADLVKLQRQNETTATTTAAETTTAAAPSPAPTTAPAPSPAPTTEAASMTDSMPELSAGQ